MKREAPSCCCGDEEGEGEEGEQESKSVLETLLRDPRGKRRRRALETHDWDGTVSARDVRALCRAAREDASDDVRAASAAVLLRLARTGRLGTDAALQSAVFAELSAVVVADPVRDARAAACAALGLLPAVPAAVLLHALSKNPLPAAIAAAVDAREASLPACALATGDIDLPRLEAALISSASAELLFTTPQNGKVQGQNQNQSNQIQGQNTALATSSLLPPQLLISAAGENGAPVVRLLSGTECVGAGALVHAVEDECAAVREAAVGALAAVAAAPGRSNSAVAARAVECLADVLTDGRDGVRGAAVAALARVTACTPLLPEQLHAALAMLEEPAPRARAAVRRLLGATTLPDAAAALAAVQALLRSVARHPADARAAYRALRRVGAHNAAAVAAAAPALLGADPRFEPVEPVADDPRYVGAAVAVLAAAAAHPPLLPRLPRYLLAHASLLYHRYPRLIPARFAALSVPAVVADYHAHNSGDPCSSAAQADAALIQLAQEIPVTEHQEEQEEQPPLDAEKFMDETLAFVYKGNPTQRQLHQCVKRLRACETLLRAGGCTARAEHAGFHWRFLECALAVSKLPTLADAAVFERTLARVFQTTYALEHTCATSAPLPPATLLALRELRLAAHTAYCDRNHSSRKDDLERRAEGVRKFATSHGLTRAPAGSSPYFPDTVPALPATLERVRVRFESPACNRDRALSWNTAFPLELACRIAANVPLRSPHVFVRAILCFDNPLVAVRPQMFPCAPAPKLQTGDFYDDYDGKDEEDDEEGSNGWHTQNVVIRVQYPQDVAETAPRATCTHIELSVVAAFATECAEPDLCFDAAAMRTDDPACPGCNAAVPLTAAPRLFYVFPKMFLQR